MTEAVASRERRIPMLVGSILVGTLGFAIARWTMDAPEPGPGVVLVTMDTFRADHLGCAGNPNIRTPHLDRLARRGTHWTEAVSPIPLTTPSHASILSGRSPRSHGLTKNRMRLPESVRTIPMELSAIGYRTGAIVSSRVVLGPEFGLDRGFDTYEVIEPEVLPASGEGAQTASAASRWIRETGGPGSFLWVHFFDAHLPYVPPEPWGELFGVVLEDGGTAWGEAIQEELRDDDHADPALVQGLRSLYAAEVSFLDACFGEVVRAAEARRPGTIFVVTADHGEGLYEHERYFGHDILLYETSMRVPLVLAGAGEAGIAREPARTLDIAPTIFGLCGVATDEAEGRDLLHEPPPTGDGLQFIAESYPSREKSTPLYAMRTEEHKIVWIPRQRRREFYDLVNDPGERHDLSGEVTDYLRILAKDLELDLHRRPPGPGQTEDEKKGRMDAKTKEQMRALGYMN